MAFRHEGGDGPPPRGSGSNGPTAATGATGLTRLRDAYDRVHPRLWRALLSWSGDREVADEATAEAFAQAARRIDEIRDVDAWLWRSGFRIAAGELHRRARRDLPVGTATEVVAEGRDIGPRTDGNLPEMVLDLVGALDQLTSQQRACVILRDLADLSARRAAQALDTSQATVRVQALRGRRKLRELLETDHD